MNLGDHGVSSLHKLSRFRSAPDLSPKESEDLKDELLPYISHADWFTLGIMASNQDIAISALRVIEHKFQWPSMKVVLGTESNGPVFLKANQKTAEVYVRNEDGLGEGILISCQYNKPNKDAETFGPFPLDFFNF